MKKLALLLTTAALISSCAPQDISDVSSNVEKSVNEMKKKPGALFAFGAASPEVKRLQKLAIESTAAYDITESLTTEIGPRLAGSEAEARARDWAVAKMKALGFENVRNEPFTIKGWERGVETAFITSPYPQQLYITSLGGSVATPPEGIEADIVFFPTFKALENAPLGGLEGKIVFISGRMEKAPDGAGYGPANHKRRRGATEAGKRGAAAVIIRSVGTDSHRFPHTGQMRYAADVAPIPIAALSAPDADQLERTFKRGDDLRVKLTLTPQDVGDLPSGNVIGEIVGSEKPEEVVIVSGHIDSWDLGTGALDDGAGVGISMGALKVILDSGLKPKRTLRVIAFGSEEVGLLGGYAYAEKHADDLKNHVLATQSDFGAGPVYELKSGVKGVKGNTVIKAMADALALPLSDTPTNGGPDIGPMHAKGVPAMRLQQDGTDYFDYHHTPDDTFDKIDPDEMAQNVAAHVTMMWMASEAETSFREE